MQNPYTQITAFLNDHNINYEELSHQPVYTSEEAASIRGLSMNEGTKSLLVKVDGKFYLFIIQGDKRLSSKKVKILLSAKKLRFATKEEVREIMHCEVGACYPFGNLIGITQFVDTSFIKNDYISLSPGTHTKSIRMKWKDYQHVMKPTLTDLCSDETG